MKKRILVLFLMLWAAAAAARGERIPTAASVTLPRDMRSFQNQTITVNAPDDGTCDLEISAAGTVYWRSTDIAVTAGDNQVIWDGTAFDG